ncbi:unnamed protein product [Candida verbasci]|uniref:Nucleolar protein Dnt1-like N-terminal domain-containing protein n=1 Tax=Candida verbasci TaxID=1227364 RepID=A0A9W4TXQ1_9ASCO|nr:unnamed protein product [Candida verbasci]
MDNKNRLRLQIIFVPKDDEKADVDENEEKSLCIKWLHFIDPNQLVQDLKDELTEKFNSELSNKYGKLMIHGIQDIHLRDIDGDLIVGNCFDDRSKCRVVVKNKLHDLTQPLQNSTSNINSPIASPVISNPPAPKISSPKTQKSTTAKSEKAVPKKSNTNGVVSNPQQTDSESDSEDDIILSRRKRKIQEVVEEKEEEEATEETNNSNLEIIDPTYSSDDDDDGDYDNNDSTVSRDKVIQADEKSKKSKVDKKALEDLDLEFTMSDYTPMSDRGDRVAAREANLKFNESRNANLKKKPKVVKSSSSKKEISSPKSTTKETSTTTSLKKSSISPKTSSAFAPLKVTSESQPPSKQKSQKSPIIEKSEPSISDLPKGSNVLNEIVLVFKSFQAKINDLKKIDENTRSTVYSRPPSNYFDKLLLEDFMEKDEIGFDCVLHLVTAATAPPSPIIKQSTMNVEQPDPNLNMNQIKSSQDHDFKDQNTFLKDQYNKEEPPTVNFGFDRELDEDGDLRRLNKLDYGENSQISNTHSSAFCKGDSFKNNYNNNKNHDTSRLFDDDDESQNIDKSPEKKKKIADCSSDESSDDDSIDEMENPKKKSRLVAQTPSQKASPKIIPPQLTNIKKEQEQIEINDISKDSKKENIYIPNKINGLPSLLDLANRGVPDVRDENEIKPNLKGIKEEESLEESSSESSSDDSDDEDSKFMSKESIQRRNKKKKNLFVSMKR